MLRVLDGWPEGLLSASPRDLQGLLGGPTLIHLPGRRGPPLFVTVLQHGNEDSGFVGLQQVLRAMAGQGLPRALTVLIGNVQAAAQGLRRLDGQPDYNRVWPGTLEHAATPEAAAMADALARVLAQRPFAAIDIHNNTGQNPHYSVLANTEGPTLYLARLFARTMVLFRGVAGAQTTALAAHGVPAVAVECGKPGVAANADAAARLITAALELAAFPAHPPPAHDVDLLHTLAIVKVPPQVTISFDGSPAHLQFTPELERYNFSELPAGTVWAQCDASLLNHAPAPLNVRGEAGQDLSAEFFACIGGQLQLARPALPAMLTPDARVVRQDCLCYLMERVVRTSGADGRHGSAVRSG